MRAERAEKPEGPRLAEAKPCLYRALGVARSRVAYVSQPNAAQAINAMIAASINIILNYIISKKNRAAATE